MRTRLDWVKYHADFFTFPTLVSVVLYWQSAFIASHPIVAALAFVWGFVFWTFAEYWIHRVALHGMFWHGTHEQHHKNPSEHVLFPLWYVPGSFVAIFGAFYLLSLIHIAAFVAFAGFAAGYVWFTNMHHLLHHIDLVPQTWLHRFAIWHNRHHRLNDRNYGITTNVWDRLFGTSR